MVFRKTCLVPFHNISCRKNYLQITICWPTPIKRKNPELTGTMLLIVLAQLMMLLGASRIALLPLSALVHVFPFDYLDLNSGGALSVLF